MKTLKKTSAKGKATGMTTKAKGKTPQKASAKAPVKKTAKKAPAAAKKTTKKTAPTKASIKLPSSKKPTAKKKMPERAPNIRKAEPMTGPMLAVYKMAQAAAKALDDAKAEDIITIDLTRKSALADYIIVASGRSTRQVAALARHAEEALHKEGAKRCRIEGQAQGDWVVVDGGDVVVHLFRPEVREFYQLEKLWSDDGGEATTRRSLA